MCILGQLEAYIKKRIGSKTAACLALRVGLGLVRVQVEVKILPGEPTKFLYKIIRAGYVT